ncbi:hypothetical protein FO675_03260 [Riemerella anatipestifer]|uniref:hypothetical protein n=1 Tax=Riemerella anatipestifer TaxID=34085 RepID=UPI001AD6284F|nr:hypothetical protein [Riemerella anatipestifer]MBO4233329.1 hypothetical protein [Riemerella anatipestifer]
MSSSPEFNKVNNISQILQDAFGYWQKTIGFQILFSILYFGLLMTFAVGLFSYFGLETEMESFRKLFSGNYTLISQTLAELMENTSFQHFVFSIMIVKSLLYPLNIGFYEIYKKIDLGEIPSTSDLIIGYNGYFFLRFFGYHLFWSMIYSYAGMLQPLPILWVFLTLFAAPLMYFLRMGIFTSIHLNFIALKTNFTTIFVGVLVAFIFSYAGFFALGIGSLLTFPFWNAMIYTLYKQIFKIKVIHQL